MMIFLSQLDDASVNSGDDGKALNHAAAVTGWWCFWRWRMRLFHWVNMFHNIDYLNFEVFFKDPKTKSMRLLRAHFDQSNISIIMGQRNMRRAAQHVQLVDAGLACHALQLVHIAKIKQTHRFVV